MSTGCSAGSDGDSPCPSASSAAMSAPASRVAASFAAGRGSRTNRAAAPIVSASVSASPSLPASNGPQCRNMRDTALRQHEPNP